MGGMHDAGAYHLVGWSSALGHRAVAGAWLVAWSGRHVGPVTIFPRRKSEEKRPFKIAWPWRKRPKPQPKPLDLIRQRVAALCQRCSDSLRRLHQAGVMWWFTDHHIEKGAPARFLFLLSNVGTAGYQVAP